MGEPTNVPRKRSFRSITTVMRHIQISGPNAPITFRELPCLASVVRHAQQKGNVLSPEILSLVEATKKKFGPACLSVIKDVE